MSILNRGQITKSRLAPDPKVFDNTDGSKKVMVTVYVDARYTGADGSRPSDRIQLQTWIGPTTDSAKTPFAHLHKGDAAAFEYELRSSEYAPQGGGRALRAGLLHHRRRAVRHDRDRQRPSRGCARAVPGSGVSLCLAA